MTSSIEIMKIVDIVGFRNFWILTVSINCSLDENNRLENCAQLRSDLENLLWECIPLAFSKINKQHYGCDLYGNEKKIIRFFSLIWVCDSANTVPGMSWDGREMIAGRHQAKISCSHWDDVSQDHLVQLRNFPVTWICDYPKTFLGWFKAYVWPAH